MKWVVLVGALVGVLPVVLFAPTALLFALPWLAAIVWVAWRAGWSVLWSDHGDEFPSQSHRLRGFGGS
jgi:hypothetical protein